MQVFSMVETTPHESRKWIDTSKLDSITIKKSFYFARVKRSSKLLFWNVDTSHEELLHSYMVVFHISSKEVKSQRFDDFKTAKAWLEIFAQKNNLCLKEYME